MNSIDLFRMGIKNLWRRKLRTFLTVLGVIIGASSIIVMISLGFGMSKGFEEQIATWGSLTTINVHKGWADPNNPKPGVDFKKINMDDKAVASFQKIPNVIGVSPTLETSATIITGRYQAMVPLRGVNPDTMEAFEFTAGEGRLLKSGDKEMIVFGSGMAQNFYDPKARMPREIKIDLMKDRFKLTFDPMYGQPSTGTKTNYKVYDIKVAGVLKEGSNWEHSYGVYMPVDEVRKLIKEKERTENVRPTPTKDIYNKIDVKVNDMKNVQKAQQAIKDMGYEAYSLNDMLESMKKTSGTLQLVLGGIGAISLLVAAIGITNTMVMSIYERTKEIGVMKVIGASIKDIQRLFLFESAAIGLLGGIIGIMLSYFLSFLLNKFGSVIGQSMGLGGSKISIIPVWLIGAALIFSTLIGIASGYYPAKRAMKLSAIEAIRTE